MLPSQFIILDQLPRQINGKINYPRLHQYGNRSNIHDTQFIQPRNIIELQLNQIWEDILLTRPIGVTDDFFKLGGNSLTAIQLMFEIENRFDVKLSLTSLFPHATIESLATQIQVSDRQPSDQSLVTIRVGSQKLPLFCVHPLSGGILCYQDLTCHLDNEQPVYGLQDPRLNSRVLSYYQVEELATRYLQEIRQLQPHGPYQVCGWSFGGLVAFEMAQQLHLMGEDISMLVLIDTFPPYAYNPSHHIDSNSNTFELDNFPEIPSWILKDVGYCLGLKIESESPVFLNQSLDEQLKYLLSMLRTANLCNPSFSVQHLHHMLGISLANHMAETNYLPKNYPGQIKIFQTASSFDQNLVSDRFNWQHITSIELESYRIADDHYQIMKRPHITTVAGYLNQWLL